MIRLFGTVSGLIVTNGATVLVHLFIMSFSRWFICLKGQPATMGTDVERSCVCRILGVLDLEDRTWK